MSKKYLGYIFAALTVLSWSIAVAVGKLLTNNLNGLQTVCYTSIISSFTLLIIILPQKRLVKCIKSYKLKDYFLFMLFAFVGTFFYYIFFYSGLKYSSAQEANVINYTWPLWTVLFAILLLKEKTNFRKIISIFLGFIGVWIVTTHGKIFTFSTAHLTGDSMALMGGICYGLFGILGKKFKYEIFTSMFFYFNFAFIYSVIAIFFFSTFPPITEKQFFEIVWLGSIAHGLGFVTWFLALRYGDTAKVSNIAFFTPFVALIFIFFLIGEKIYVASIIGLLFIVVGLIIQQANFIHKFKLKNNINSNCHLS